MLNIEQLDVNGATVQGTMVVAPGGEGHPNMILVQGRKGYLMCGYLNLAAAEKFGMKGDIQAGANIAGFLKVADAMLAQGVV